MRTVIIQSDSVFIHPHPNLPPSRGKGYKEIAFSHQGGRNFCHRVFSMKLLAAAVAFVGGVQFATEIGVAPVVALLPFAAAALLGALLLVSLRRSPLVALAALAFILGVARVAMAEDAPMPSYASARIQQVEGVTLSDAESLGSFARFRLGVERIQTGGGEWADAEGTLLVTARPPVEMARSRDAPYFRYGDRLLVEGRISEPPELDGFDYAAYLARQGIAEVLDARGVALIGTGEGSAFYRSLYEFRRRLAASIATVVPEPQAALGQATLLGLRRNIPTELTEAFRITGAAHLLAISGLHVGILLGISLTASAALLGRKHHLHLIAPLVVIWLYGLLSGMSPSATRACIMGSVYLASLGFGTQRGGLTPIGCAAALMVAVSPSIVYSISFQLSFAAVAGIAAFSEAFGGMFRMLTLGRRWTGLRSVLRAPQDAVTSILGVSIAATVATLPLIAFHFERVSTLGIPASVLTLPALPFLIVSSAGAALVGLVSATLATPFGWLAWGAGAYLSGVVTLLAGLPGAAVDIGSLPAWAVVVYYGGLLIVYGFMRAGWGMTSMGSPSTKLRTGIDRMVGDGGSTGSPRTKNLAIWLLVPAAFVASLVWSDALARDDRLHVVFFDVGQGDAIFIETPGGRQVVVDGGADALTLTRLLGERMRFYDRRIDIVAATHPHGDHIGGLAQVLERYDVGVVLERRMEHDGAAYQAWARAVDAEAVNGARVIEASAGQVITLDDDIRLEVLGPPDTLSGGAESDINDASLVLRLVYGEVSVLLTGDIFAEGERALLRRGAALDSDVLKVAHHGSGSSSTAEFLDAVSPAAAVISVGTDNRFGHPDGAVVERLREFVPDDMLLLTSERGAVEFVTDGERLWVRTER